jgi:hypothetical protein
MQIAGMEMQSAINFEAGAQFSFHKQVAWRCACVQSNFSTLGKNEEEKVAGSI